jgi:hypothetical protein
MLSQRNASFLGVDTLPRSPKASCKSERLVQLIFLRFLAAIFVEINDQLANFYGMSVNCQWETGGVNVLYLAKYYHS